MADWSKLKSRGNVEDRRGMNPSVIGGGFGLVGIVIVLVFNLLSGNDPTTSILNSLNQLQGSTTVQSQGAQPSQFAGADQYETFASEVLGSNNDLWKKVLTENGKTYQPPKLVLFRTATQSGCGGATSAAGPHYCPRDSTVYLDETFFDELRTKFGAKGGDVAEAYVISHEVGHHVQNQLGVMQKLQSQNDPAVSVKVELQADCYAGVWSKSVASAGVIKPGEINEAVDAAAAVGDDRIQQKVEGQINSETWTHGSSKQRVQWFNTGYDSGSPAQCNTFK
ncbi:MAG: neutral zinc metallopeptidase [Patescibacteria group bacterium]|nr:neutral zinc metallopeptidase [Patescibacteria group bacterium]